MSTSLPRTLSSVVFAIGGGVAGVMALCYGTGFLIDPTMELTTTRDLDANSDDLSALIGSADGVVEWWQAAGELHGENRISERIQVRATDPEHVEFLAGDQVFETWALVSATETSATWDIEFPKMTTRRTLSVEPLDAGTRMVWEEVADVQSPVLRWTTMLPMENVSANFQGAMLVAEAAAQARAASKAEAEAEVVPEAEVEAVEGEAPAQP
ncbi:MAG: hypothetical protein KC912_04290 [Proteobacteria bacterium]|nr:hypothetical protein [Pseudomonadota bacterium]